MMVSSSMSYRLSHGLASLITILFVGCSGNIEQVFSRRNAREYDVVVNRNDSPFLKASCRYLGREPADIELFKKVFKHDYESKTTDFYSIKIENLFDRTIRIKEVNYRFRRGSYRGKSKFNSDEIAMTWGQAVIEPNKRIQRDTHFVWAIKDNVLEKTFLIESVDESGEVFELELMLPLQFIR